NHDSFDGRLCQDMGHVVSQSSKYGSTRFVGIIQSRGDIIWILHRAQFNLLAVGSQAHISVVDPRSASIVHEIDSVDDGWGVRSLNFNNHIITTGGGFGRLSFYDMRAQKYLEFPVHTDTAESSMVCNYKETGSGWLHRDALYMNHFAGYALQNAIYTLSYDQSGTKLFTGGGPLQLGLKGSYAALWS
ncbi:3092_t:CDS:2, partial [Acaulospora colombiana]